MGINKLISEFKSGFASFINIEKDASLINKEVTDASLSAGKRLAEAIGEEVSVVEALRATYQSQQAGARFNTKGLHNLYRATLRTGEDFKGLMEGLIGANAGLVRNSEQLGGLASSTSRLSGVLNLSRTQLVAAMGAVSDKLKDTQSALGANALAFNKGIMSLKGFLRSDAMHKGITSAMEDLMTGTNAIQKSLLLGVRQERLAMLGGLTGGQGATGFLTQMLTVMQKGADKTVTLLRPYAGTDISAKMVQTFDAQGRTSSAMLRAWEQVQFQANQMFGTQNKRYGIKKIVEALERRQSEAREFANTFLSFKSMVMVPLMNAMVEMAKRFKSWLSSNKNDLKNLITEVASGVQTLFKALLGIASGISVIVNFLQRLIPGGKGGAGGAVGNLMAMGLYGYAGLKVARGVGTAWGGMKSRGLVGAKWGGVPQQVGGAVIPPGGASWKLRAGQMFNPKNWKASTRWGVGLAALGYGASKIFGGDDDEEGGGGRGGGGGGAGMSTLIGGMHDTLDAILNVGDINTKGFSGMTAAVTGSDTAGLLNHISGYARFQAGQSTKIAETLGQLRDIQEEEKNLIKNPPPQKTEIMVRGGNGITHAGYRGLKR